MRVTLTIYEIVKKIEIKAHEEGFNDDDDEIHDLLRQSLRKFLDRNQVNYILYVKGSAKTEKGSQGVDK